MSKYEIVDGKLKRKMSIFWWTQRWTHLFFIARELTSLCVAYTAIFLMFFVRAINNGPEAYASFMEAMKSPLFIVIHLFVAGGLIFHTITWLNLAPKAMVIKLGKRRVPKEMILAANYGGWLVVSLIIIWFLI